MPGSFVPPHNSTPHIPGPALCCSNDGFGTFVWLTATIRDIWESNAVLSLQAFLILCNAVNSISDCAIINLH